MVRFKTNTPSRNPLPSRLIISLCAMIVALSVGCHASEQPRATATEQVNDTIPTVVSANNRTELYVPMLRGKRVALLGNHTSMLAPNADGTRTHLLDTLLSMGIDVQRLFCPEHGFRGEAEAGAAIGNAVDYKSGLPIVSLYGKHKKPQPEELSGLDIVVVDLQDVGCRFYTYISTLHYMMEACAENNVKVLVLDRINPNGHYVDGPVLEATQRSFVGMHPVPIVYGMTIGEYATMINGERWLKEGKQCALTVIPMQGYSHRQRHAIDLTPSPNLRTEQAIWLYPSLCWYEGTTISVGRGTDWPFEVVGTPHGKRPNDSLSFVPKTIKGVASHPPFEGKMCHGADLRRVSVGDSLNLSLLIELYERCSDTIFFLPSKFFDRLAGTAKLRQQLISHASEQVIRSSWQKELAAFMDIRKKYLLYPDFQATSHQ